MEVVKNEKSEIRDERIQTNPATKEAGQEGIEKIIAFLERIGYPPEKMQERAAELWDEWLRTGHWWTPSDAEILAFLEGEL